MLSPSSRIHCNSGIADLRLERNRMTAQGTIPQDRSKRMPASRSSAEKSAIQPRDARRTLRSGQEAEGEVPRTSHAAWKAVAQSTGSIATHAAVEQGAYSGTHPDSPWANAAHAVYVLSRSSAQHGGGSGHDTGDRPARAGLRRLPSDEFRRFCYTGTTVSLRHQRHGRDSPGTLGVGRETSRRELRSGLSQQWIQRGHRKRRRTFVCAIVS